MYPDAWVGSKTAKRGARESAQQAGTESPYPVQVSFQIVHNFKPLKEAQFKDIMEYRGNTHNFNFMLKPAQVAALVQRFVLNEKDN